MRALAHRDLFRPLFAALVVLAWATLWAWARSPWGRYLHAADLGEICFAPGTPGIPLDALLHVAGWVLMTTAMMLPTTLPLIEIFRRLTRQRADRAQLVSLLVAGYLLAWLAFAAVAHLADGAVHRVVDPFAVPGPRAWVLGALPLLLAGGYQFTELKYRCLDRCRTPLAFVMQHWRGDAAALQALRLGAHHGLFCIGCCWALMLLMFSVGIGSVGWMLLLGTVMALEKNSPWGHRLSAPLGIALLAWGGVTALGGLGLLPAA